MFYYLKLTPPSMYYFLVSNAKIIFIRNGKYLQLLCISCLKALTTLHHDQVFVSITSMDLGHIDAFVRHINSNLLNALVAQNLLRSSAGCSPIVFSRTLAGACAQDVLGSKFNFTPSPMPFKDMETGKFRQTSKLHSSAVVFEMISDRRLTNWITNYYKKEGILFDYVITAEIFSSFTFLLVIPEPALIHSALWEGMDAFTWGLIALSTFAAILALKFVRGQNLSTMNASEVVLFFLLEQGQLPSKNSLQTVGIKGALIVAIWSMVSTVISNGYKGNMFSLLSSISLPNIPVNWEDIVKSERFLVSTASFIIAANINDNAKHSMLHSSIDELQAEGRISQRLNKTLSELSHKLVFTNATSSVIAYSQTSRGKEIGLPSPSQLFRLPDDYIFIQQDRHLELYSLLMKVAKSNALVLQGPSQDLFSERIPIMMVRNFFTENYTKMFFQIVESGLYSLWKKYSDMYAKLNEMKKFIELVGKVEPEFESNNSTTTSQVLADKMKSRHNLLALIWGDAKTTRGITDLVGLRLDTFRIVFVFYGLGMFTSLAPFLYEMYGNKMWARWRNPTTLSSISNSQW
ncbi:unnamed protein product [Allacma fusca]|uniref:Uncharacterized protein n=1 Tax=Allacma fusca TaxID=39272 RepID=A0A8J2KUC8_9HEXA|nr:unnamed protein product [Allacma fusca]